jgi:hypothetical protein
LPGPILTEILKRADTAVFEVQESEIGGFLMKSLFGVGLAVLILGILSFFVPIPHSEHHGVSAGDVHLGVTTEHSDRLPYAFSIVVVVVGAGLMIAGKSKSA